ncbi:SpoIIE family protein phosphatase [Streptomyces sp. M10(2022)]
MCQVASAGHLPPVFIDPGTAGARVARLPVGPPLGMGFGGYRTVTVPCPPGTVLFMYTDGLVERRVRTSTCPSGGSRASPCRRADSWMTCWTM